MSFAGRSLLPQDLAVSESGHLKTHSSVYTKDPENNMEDFFFLGSLLAATRTMSEHGHLEHSYSEHNTTAQRFALPGSARGSLNG